MANRRFLVAALLAAPTVAGAQGVVGARAGLIYSFEGEVRIDDRALEETPGRFTIMGVRSELRASSGQAQVILAPGAILHVYENSAVRLLDNRVEQPHVELTAGSFRLECTGRCGRNRVTFAFGEALVTVEKRGEYEFDAELGRLTVLRGRARVRSGGTESLVRQGEVVIMNDGVRVASVRPVTARY